MSEKVEWEVVDTEGAQPNGPRPPRSPDELLKAMLGPWWRWKVGAVTVVAGLALLFFAALAGVVVLTVIAFAMLALAFARLRSWLRKPSSREATRRRPDEWR